MKIWTLMENTAISTEIKSSHGLSFYIETEKHKILFDMGQDDGFLENAEKLGIDLAEVDIAFLSHGHYDHGGGIDGFLKVNKKAKIHIQKAALEEYWAQDPEKKRYIGLSESWKNNERIIIHEGDYSIDEELQIFARVTERDCYSPANDRLLKKINGSYEKDGFVHEQNLLIHEKGKTVLFAGCAHNGMVNIMKKASALLKFREEAKKMCTEYGKTEKAVEIERKIEAVFGGMHLKGAFETEEELEEFCHKMSKKLMQYDSTYYTCHCTSLEAYKKLHAIMKEKIQYASAGSVWKI